MTEEENPLHYSADELAESMYDPAVPLQLLQDAAALDPDKRTEAAVIALGAMAAGGMSAAATEMARDYAKRHKLVSAAGFDRIIKAARGADAKSEPERKSASTELAEIACERYDFGLSDAGDTFAVPKAGPRVAVMLRGGKTSLRSQLARDYYTRTGRAAAQQALADAMMVIEGIAQEQDETRLYLRCARHDGDLWLDLGDQAGRAVRITATGWRIEADAPVLFKRTALNGPLPDPVSGGSIRQLWDLLNVAEADQPLVIALLIACLFPDIPHPVLGLFGEQGTGKSTAARILAMLIDPGPVPVRKPPRDADSWVTAAAGSWLVAIDNLSDIPPWLSDSLCRAVTGDGDVRRKLYTDGELAVFAYRRCIILNGIDTGAMAADLAERMLAVTLEFITERTRRTEEDLWPAWREAHPQILGALLDLAAQVLTRLSSVELVSKPRMADFARIAAAVDAALGTDGLSRYLTRAADLAADGLSGDSFAGRVLEVVGAAGFDGTSAELLEQVTPHAERWRAPRDWPKDGRAVTTRMHRIAPALRKLGWTFAEGRDSHSKLISWKLSPPSDPEKARADHRSSPQPPHASGDAVIGGDESGPTQDAGQEETPPAPPARPCGKCGREREDGQTVLCIACLMALTMSSAGPPEDDDDPEPES